MIFVVIPIAAALCAALWFSPLGSKVGIWSWPKTGAPKTSAPETSD